MTDHPPAISATAEFTQTTPMGEPSATVWYENLVALRSDPTFVSDSRALVDWNVQPEQKGFSAFIIERLGTTTYERSQFVPYDSLQEWKATITHFCVESPF